MKRKDELHTTDAFGRASDPKMRSLDEEDMTSALARRQNSYGKFFEGYTERKVLVNGRARIVREYTGTIYRQECTKKQAKRIRWIYAALFILSVTLFIGALCLPTPSNSCWYVSLCALLPAVLYGWVLLSLHTYVWSKQEMTIYEFCYGSIALQKRPVFAALSALLPIAAAVVMLGLNGLSVSLLELLRNVLLIISGVLMCLLKVMESKVKYQTIDPES